MRSHNFKALPIVYKTSFHLQLEDGSMKAETCSFYILLITYILHNKVVLSCKCIYVIDNIIVCVGIHGNFSLFTSGSNGPSAAATTAEFAEVTVVPVATAGPCNSPCRTIFPFLILLFFMTFIVAVTQMPLLMIVLRFVSSCVSSLYGLLPLTLRCQLFLYTYANSKAV
jgi:hypothetical protein